MGAPALSISHLSKDYHHRSRTLSLREAVKDALLSPFRRRATKDAATPAHALDDVSFEVESGDVVGIIGHNGAGKSTLLKVLSRVTEPTSGRAEIRGRIGSLLEVGTGFHPELTGRENVYLSAAILGMSRAEIERRFADIVAFAEISPAHLDMPVKKYSSGMYVRLGFAVASHLEPEILLIDEVLSVGDMAFQRKCLTRMRALTRDARIILLVTHNMMSVRGICNRAILLSRGRIAAHGAPDVVIPAYEKLALAGESDDPRAVEIDQGMGQVKITGLTLFDRSNGSATVFGMGDPLRVHIEYDAVVEVPHAVIYAAIRKLDGFICSGTSTATESVAVPPLRGAGVVDVTFPSVDVTPGMYVLDVTFYDENFEHRQYFLGRRRITFHVESPLGQLDDRYGVVYPHARWNIGKSNDA